MVLDPIPQCLPVHIFGSRPQPPTSPCLRKLISADMGRSWVKSLTSIENFVTWLMSLYHLRMTSHESCLAAIYLIFYIDVTHELTSGQTWVKSSVDHQWSRWLQLKTSSLDSCLSTIYQGLHMSHVSLPSSEVIGRSCAKSLVDHEWSLWLQLKTAQEFSSLHNLLHTVTLFTHVVNCVHMSRYNLQGGEDS